MSTYAIPFNKPYMTGRELWYIAQAHANGHLSGDGPFTQKCHRWIEQSIGVKKALLTHSCTAALEMAAILADIQPGDEVIMPSYTFVSTANAFVLRGAIPVYVDIRLDTLNIDESKIEAAITPKTKVIVPVHYAGVGCDMNAIMAIAERHQLLVIEDAAQGVMSSYKGRPLGSFGHMAAISFHETKNIISGEGGALLINDNSFVERAEIIREKGTNRSKFFRGEVDKYTWVDLGSSYLPSELIAAFLWAQIESANEITLARLAIWNKYHDAFMAAETSGFLRRPVIPDGIHHNAHMYYLIFHDLNERTDFISFMKEEKINTVFHYVPLHTSPFGRSISAVSYDLVVSEVYSERIVRLPLWVDMTDDMVRLVIDAVGRFLMKQHNRL
jgi:dTDP-4-amino-4,6-dideoxygalactose transaminase